MNNIAYMNAVDTIREAIAVCQDILNRPSDRNKKNLIVGNKWISFGISTLDRTALFQFSDNTPICCWRVRQLK